MSTLETYIGEDLQVVVSYDYSPEQIQIMHGPRMQPGFPEEVDITGVCPIGTELDFASELSEKCITRLESEVMADIASNAAAAEEARGEDLYDRRLEEQEDRRTAFYEAAKPACVA